MKVNSIAKNTSYFTLALILQKIISFSYFAIMARYLGPEDLGKYYLAISFTTIFSIIIDLGLSNVLTRETARLQGEEVSEIGAEERRKELLLTILSLKLPLALLAFFSVFVFSWGLGYPALVKELILISSVSMLLDSFTLTFWAYVRGYHNLKYESIGSVGFQAIVFILGLICLEFGASLALLMGSMALASLANFLYSSSLVRFKFGIRFRFSLPASLTRQIIALSIPFALYAVLQRLFMYLDSVLLSMFATDRDVGLYQIAFKIVFALQFLPMAFTASLYPAFSLYYKDNKEQLAVSFERAMNYLLIISLPISLGIIALSDQVMLFFKPEYAEAAQALRIAMLALIFIFLNFPIGSLLNACDRQRINTRNMAIVLVFSVLLNSYLIPRYQASGASLTVLLSNGLMFLLGLAAVPSIVKLRYRRLSGMVLRILFSTLIMFGVTLLLRDSLPLFLNIPFSAIIYGIALFLFRGFSREDIVSVFKSFR